MDKGQDQSARPDTARDVSLTLRAPNACDGRTVHELVAACPPLDPNSLYCNLLQCTHFAATCGIAERGGQALGFVSGYRLPEAPEVLFIWQVAVHPAARGLGLGGQLIREVLARPTCAGVTHLHTTITASNDASWGLFTAFARDLAAPLASREFFDRHVHLDGRHETEILVTIGPFNRCTQQHARGATHESRHPRPSPHRLHPQQPA